MIAKESGLFVKTSTETDYGTLSTHVEADFSGDDNASVKMAFIINFF